MLESSFPFAEVAPSLSLSALLDAVGWKIHERRGRVIELSLSLPQRGVECRVYKKKDDGRC